MARTWPPQPPTPMIDSLRDQLLNLGFKAPEPERKPGPAQARRDQRRASLTSKGKAPAKKPQRR